MKSVFTVTVVALIGSLFTLLYSLVLQLLVFLGMTMDRIFVFTAVLLTVIATPGTSVGMS
jgi:hypothetical protein